MLHKFITGCSGHLPVVSRDDGDAMILSVHAWRYEFDDVVDNEFDNDGYEEGNNDGERGWRGGGGGKNTRVCQNG